MSRTTIEETGETEMTGVVVSTDIQETETTAMTAIGRLEDEELLHLMQGKEDIHARRRQFHQVVGCSRVLLRLENGLLA